MDKLILKFIRKWKEPKIAKLSWKRIKLQDSHFLISKTEYKATVLWPPDSKIWLTGKDPDAREDWGQEEKGVTEDEKLNGITDSMDMSLSKLREKVLDR